MIGLYVGLATVGVFIYWFTTDDFDGHTLVTLDQLMNWGQCSAWGGFSAEPMMGMDFSSDPCNLDSVLLCNLIYMLFQAWFGSFNGLSP